MVTQLGYIIIVFFNRLPPFDSLLVGCLGQTCIRQASIHLSPAEQVNRVRCTRH